MYVEASSPRYPGDTAAMELASLSGSQPACVVLWYHMWGDSMGTLTLKLRHYDTQQDTELYSISGKDHSSIDVQLYLQEVTDCSMTTTIH